MTAADLSLPLAFGAGILAFVSPCFLPLVPVTVSMLATEGGEVSGGARWVVLRRALVFVASFSAVFASLWIGVAAIGPALTPIHTPLRVAAGAVLIILGFASTGWLRFPFLQRTFQLRLSPQRHRPGWLRAALMGIAFGCGWTPCIGPVLGAVLTLAATSGSLGRGLLLMLAFSAALGLPFVAMAVGAGSSRRLTGWLQHHHGAIRLTTAGLLVVTGFLVMTDSLDVLSRYVPELGGVS